MRLFNHGLSAKNIEKIALKLPELLLTLCRPFQHQCVQSCSFPCGACVERAARVHGREERIFGGR
jgi:hypothetical protein